MKYLFVFSVDLCKASPGVGELMSDINAELSRFGVPERFGVRSQWLRMTCDSPRVLTQQEKKTLSDEALKLLRERLPELDIRLESVRRQSRKSRSQSR